MLISTVVKTNRQYTKNMLKDIVTWKQKTTNRQKMHSTQNTQVLRGNPKPGENHGCPLATKDHYIRVHK